MPQFGGPECVIKSMKTKEKTALNERRPRPDRRYPARSHRLIGKILPIQIAGMWGGTGGNLTHQVTGSFRTFRSIATYRQLSEMTSLIGSEPSCLR